MFNPLALLSRMVAASRSSEMDHADVDVAVLVLPVVLIVASGRAIRMVKKAEMAVSTRATAKALAASSGNRLMDSEVDAAAVAVVVVAAATIVVVVVALDAVVAVAEVAVVSDVVVVDAAAVVALATNHLTQRQNKTRKLLLTIKKLIFS